MIVQGENEPVVLEFQEDMTALQDFSALLFMKYSRKEQKRWSKDEIDINENVITLPLSQTETLAFDYGIAVLQIKWMINDEIFTNESECCIKKWIDDSVLEAS